MRAFNLYLALWARCSPGHTHSRTISEILPHTAGAAGIAGLAVTAADMAAAELAGRESAMHAYDIVQRIFGCCHISPHRRATEEGFPEYTCRVSPRWNF